MDTITRLGRETARRPEVHRFSGLVFFAVLPPALLLCDAVHPFLYERRQRQEVAIASNSIEPAITRSEIMVAVGSLAVIVVIVAAAILGRQLALARLTILIWSCLLAVLAVETVLRAGRPPDRRCAERTRR